MLIAVVVLVIIGCYFIGCFPTSYIVAKRLKGIDIREHGSGNVGATNVFRVVGKGPGIFVFFIDFIKGCLAVLIAMLLIKSSPNKDWFIMGAGLAALIGHMWPVFLRFRGGKGVATGAGVLCVISIQALVIAIAVWILVLAITRYVSMASLFAALSAVLYFVISKAALPYTLLVILAVFLIFLRHMSNIKRLMSGGELKTE